MAGGLDIKQKRAIKESFGAIKFMGGALIVIGLFTTLIGYGYSGMSTSYGGGGSGQFMLIVGILVLIIGILSILFAYRAKGTLIDAEVLPL